MLSSGVIAAVTVPVLYANYQEQALKSALKKNYSALKQALDRYQSDNTERLIPEESAHLGIKKSLVKYMNVMYDCGIGYQDNTSCITYYSEASGKSDETSKNYKDYSGKSDINLSLFDDGQFVLADGSLVLIEHAQDGSQRCFISVDVNGFGKKPNRLGRDLFMFQLTQEGELLPMGSEGTAFAGSYYCSRNVHHSTNGASCTKDALLKK